MKSRMMIACCVGLLVLLTVVPAVTHAAVPQQINYQGFLTDSEGNAVPDGDYEMSFAIYDASTGGNGLWSEAQTVTVTNGIYNIILGHPLNPIDSGIFDGNRYLSVTVTPDIEEMTPRQKITATAFTLKAAKAEDADTLDGKDSTEFSETSHSHSFSDISGTATDAQIPNNITIDHASSADFAGHADSADSADYATHADTADNAANAGNADTVDGEHASAFSQVGHDHDTVYYTQAQVDTKIAGLEARIAQLETLLAAFSVSGDGKNVYITASNLHIRSGGGNTFSPENGLGNLIVGYDECRATGSDKTGSHNLVVGPYHNYTSYGGLVAGFKNTVTAEYASVCGGRENRALGYASSVSGGQENRAVGFVSSVSGGHQNSAGSTYDLTLGKYASVSGGYNNYAYGESSSVSGGSCNDSGRWDDVTLGKYASVSGGGTNAACGDYSSVSGGGI